MTAINVINHLISLEMVLLAVYLLDQIGVGNAISQKLPQGEQIQVSTKDSRKAF